MDKMEIEFITKKIDMAKSQINDIVKGKEDVVEKIMAAIFAGGNILLEDIPGVGKTTLALAISKTMGLDYKRVQFTPDVLPSDITGFSMFNRQTNEFEYREGAAMTNLLLADEINRTSPKTQSALLEIMEEKKVTVDGVTHNLPDPFIVIATENPIGSSGTQMLPESQLDRFMILTSLGYPSHEDAINILRDNVHLLLDNASPALNIADLLEIRDAVNSVEVHDSIFDYIVTITEKTRTDERVAHGASPRGSLALLSLSKAIALMRGRDYLIPADISTVIGDCLGHRIKLSNLGKASGLGKEAILSDIVSKIPIPATSGML